jgi:EmrB/QacA subfamily drug resistance transporter
VSTETAPQVTSAAAADPAGYRLRWFGLAVILAVEIMDLLDTMIVGIAAPSIRADFGGGSAQIQWTTAAYTLAFSVVMITGARLGDIAGRKRMFLIGVLGFTVCSALCAAAAGAGMLIGCRALQGVFAGLVVPQGLGLIRRMFPPKEMGAAFGAFGPVMGLSAVGGPVLGGWLTGADLFGLGWRSIFLINVPIGLFALIAAVRVLPESRAPRSGADAPKLDLRGSALIGTGVLMLVFPLVQGRELGWPGWCFALLAASLPVLGGFAWYQRRLKARGGSPLVEPGLFTRRGFVSSLGVAMAVFAGMSGLLLVFGLHLQLDLGYTPLHAGTTLIPWAVGMVAGVILTAAKLGPKYGRKVLQAGLALLAPAVAGLALTVRLGGSSLTSWQLVPALLGSGFAIGLGIGQLFDIALAGVPEEETGSASGVMNANQQLAGSIGVAALGTAYFSFGRYGTEWTLLLAAGAFAVAVLAASLMPLRARPEDGAGH